MSDLLLFFASTKKTINPTFNILFIVLTVVAVVAAVGLFFAMIYPNRGGKVQLYRIKERHPIEGEMSNHIKNVAYYEKEKAVVVERMPGTSSMVISLLTSTGANSVETVYSLDFSNGDIVVIPLQGSVIKYRVVLKRADDKKLKDPKGMANGIAASVFYGFIPGIIAAVALVMYAVYASQALKKSYPGYAVAYILPPIMLIVIPVIVSVGLYILVRFLAYKKGGNK